MARIMVKFLELFNEEELLSALSEKLRKAYIRGDIPYFPCCMDAIVLQESNARLRKETFRECFSEAKNKIEDQVRWRETKQDELELLRSFRRIISMDLSFSHISCFLYKNKQKNFECCLPDEYYDKGGKLQKIEGKIRTVKVKDQYVVEIIHDAGKWLRHIKRKDPLDPEKYIGEEPPRFYPDLSLILQGNGCIHRTAEAFVNARDGEGRVRQYDIGPLFDNVKTDGAHWLSIHDDRFLGTVGDYRLALLFWIRQQELCAEREAI